LFKTKNSIYWAQGDTDFHTDFVSILPDAAEYLIQRRIKLVGIDYLSVAPFKESRPTHEALLKSEVVIVEGLDLSGVPVGLYKMCCLPLKLKGADGAPARVVLVAE